MAVTAAITVLVLASLVAALAMVGAAMVKRHHATAAADAVALAHASGMGSHVADWYRLDGGDVTITGDIAQLEVGDAHASSRARRNNTLTVAPALVAVLARAEQLLGTPLPSAVLEGSAVRFSASEHAQFAAVAHDLTMCETLALDGAVQWQLC